MRIRQEDAMESTAESMVDIVAEATSSALDGLLGLDLPEGTPRPLAILSEYTRRYPRARKLAEVLREGKGSAQLGGWSEWCYLPLGAAQAIVCVDRGVGRLDTALALDAAVLGALLPWRITKGIYRFDPDVLQSLWSTPITGDIPTGVLRRLPEWCCYVKLPPVSPATTFDPPDWHRNLKGFFVHLEWDPLQNHPDFRLVLDRETGLLPTALKLDASTIRGCWRSTQKESLLLSGVSEEDAEAYLSGEDAEIAGDTMSDLIAPFVSVALYLCFAEPEIVPARGDNRRPGNPEPRRTKKHGEKLFAAQEVREWDVAWRIGQALRRASDAEGDAANAEGSASSACGASLGTRKGPHVRRGHWHSYWRGPRAPERADEREKTVMWIPPLAINVGAGEADELPAVVRPVE